MSKADELISQAMDGLEPSYIISHVTEQGPKVLATRKRVRKEAPNLYRHVSDLGLLHDFAIDLGELGVKELAKKYEIPTGMMKDLKKFV